MVLALTVSYGLQKEIESQRLGFVTKIPALIGIVPESRRARKEKRKPKHATCLPKRFLMSAIFIDVFRNISMFTHDEVRRELEQNKSSN